MFNPLQSLGPEAAQEQIDHLHRMLMRLDRSRQDTCSHITLGPKMLPCPHPDCYLVSQKNGPLRYVTWKGPENQYSWGWVPVEMPTPALGSTGGYIQTWEREEFRVPIEDSRDQRIQPMLVVWGWRLVSSDRQEPSAPRAPMR